MNLIILDWVCLAQISISILHLGYFADIDAVHFMKTMHFE